ncbi:YeeE/YedE family protein [Quisquiliibacterium transsilvanicum]|jgi:uncharacterized membrane protein YedE/YeeE|uniref:Sulphur transport domain-containing protein n=1 Tax=Quisquiliibacterium transsilvanicum TaxID=1549638 RepID=A0A7W8M9Q5_9BURK|nr:hypothetical protein [Quisquiliibacterium transsilvanicum]
MIEQLFPNGSAHYLGGGLLLGVAVAGIFVATGLVAGMSTVFSSSWSWFSRLPFFAQERFTGSRQWRLVMAVGLVLGALLAMLTVGGGVPVVTGVSWWQLALGGFIGGFGARLANGCTSGHGICGMGSLQLPSLLAVLIFLATAMITANLVSALGGA